MKKPDNIIRIGDVVEIIEPQLYVRTGYDLSKESIKLQFSDEDRKKISDLVMHFKLGDSDTPRVLCDKSIKAYEKIEDEIAHIKLINNQATGSERKIFTEYNPHLKNAKAIVVGKFTKITGIYHRSSSYQSWDEWDYTPAYLNKQKCHLIYRLQLPNKWAATPFAIEKKNLRKITT